jgi:hypothetical protein
MSKAQLRAVDRTSKESGTSEQGRTTLTALLATLAAETNGAASAEEAMRRCLEHISKYGRWTVGRLARFSQEASGTASHASVWQVSETQRFADFIRHSEETPHSSTRGRFVGRMLREKQPVTALNAAGSPRRPRLLAITPMAVIARHGLVVPTQSRCRQRSAPTQVNVRNSLHRTRLLSRSPDRLASGALLKSRSRHRGNLLGAT